jgi:ubiquinone/menaquinone biosynthesis C-methylase UbiE
MDGMAFTDRMASRAAIDYADFLLPHLTGATHVLDIGCGDGALTAGVLAWCGRVTAVDVSADDFRQGAATLGLANLTFVQADAIRLPFPAGTFDAVMAHSVLESGVEPALVLAQALRVLRPGGWLAAASVDYGALLLAGPDVELLRRSNDIREQTWLRSGADPFLGRELRRLITEAGFVNVEATTKAFSYGTAARVREFAAGRASECSDAGYVAAAVERGLTTEDEMAEMAAAWSRWGQSQAAYAGFTWCRAVARRATPVR